MQASIPATSSDPEPDLGAADQSNMPEAVANVGPQRTTDSARQTGTTTPLPSHDARTLASSANAAGSHQCSAVDMTSGDVTKWQIVTESKRTMRPKGSSA